ncbi:unnamed protein product [Caenorhabditis bovis]|uniref:Domain of unknown function DB domain-containing protein n=1 Tax=Caenorhabditis bovis TaxID=2654633 RepID=A0A8S1EXH5_9PELO|nr:unnamed protein product [Caenorhabditis bovis]
MSSIRAILILLAISVECLLADLPSCSRAKCVHCAVDFIARMCPTACAGCNRQIAPPQSPQPVVYNTQPQFGQSVNTRQVSNEGGAVYQQQRPQQYYQQQQAGLHLPVQQQPIQFAAPNYQQPAIPYPQQQQQAPIQTATLAPLVQPPKVSTLDQTLSSRPADLAQPLPEYNAAGGGVVAQLPSPQAPQLPAFPQPAYNLFNQPNPFQLPGQQQQQQQPQSALLNPFQQFMQPGANPLDLFNLFNLNGAQPLAQAANTQQYGQVQHQGNYSPPPPVVQQPQQQLTVEQQQKQYQQQYQQYQQQLQQYQQQQQQRQQQTYQPYQQQQYSYQGQQTYQQTYQQPQQPQLPVVQQTQQPQAAKPAAPLPKPAAAAAASVDSRPVSFVKYVDPGKGTPLAAAQCPRQPGWQPCITKQVANDRFKNCCARLGEGCAPLCEYDATLATMQLAVLTGRCPLNKVGDVMICASGYQDATQCCEAYGVFEPGYEHCRPYCNPSAGLPEGGLLTEKYKCLVKLSHIQQCFFVSQKP